jgi:SAM-dependent methyltransferase
VARGRLASPAVASIVGPVTNRDDAGVDAAREKWDHIDLDLVRQVAWTSLSTVNESIWRGFSADPPAQVLARHLIALHREDVLAGVAVVCGDMKGERVWFEELPGVSFKSVDGYDISAASMDRYTPANGTVWRAHQQNCNRLVLPEGTFDLAVAWHGAHHIENLAGLFYQIHQSLRQGGMLLMYEWIGPEYLQIPATNAIIARLCLLLMFARKERTTHMGKAKGLFHLQYRRSSFDPSEACNSTDLLHQYLRYFSPLAQNLHGGLLYPVFEGIAQNLDEKEPRTAARIKRIIRLERILTFMGIIKPLFAVSLGVRRDGIVGSARRC